MCANATPYWSAVNSWFVVKEMEIAEKNLEEAKTKGLDITLWYLWISSTEFPFRERSFLERLTGSSDWWYMHNCESPGSYLERMLTSAETYKDDDKIYLVKSDVALVLSLEEISSIAERREVMFFDASEHHTYHIPIHDVKGEVEVRTKKERITYQGWIQSDKLPDSAEKLERKNEIYVLWR